MACSRLSTGLYSCPLYRTSHRCFIHCRNSRFSWVRPRISRSTSTRWTNPKHTHTHIQICHNDWFRQTSYHIHYRWVYCSDLCKCTNLLNLLWIEHIQQHIEVLNIFVMIFSIEVYFMKRNHTCRRVLVRQSESYWHHNGWGFATIIECFHCTWWEYGIQDLTKHCSRTNLVYSGIIHLKKRVNPMQEIFGAHKIGCVHYAWKHYSIQSWLSSYDSKTNQIWWGWGVHQWLHWRGLMRLPILSDIISVDFLLKIWVGWYCRNSSIVYRCMCMCKVKIWQWRETSILLLWVGVCDINVKFSCRLV